MLKVFERSFVVLLTLVCVSAFKTNAQDFNFRTHAGKKQVHSWRDSTAVKNQNAKSGRISSNVGNSPYVWAIFSKPMSNQLKNSLDSMHVSVLGTTGRQENSIAYKLKIRNNQDAVINLLKENTAFVNTVVEAADDKIPSSIQKAIATKSSNDTLRLTVTFNSDISKDSIIELLGKHTDSLIFESNIFPINNVILVSKVKNITQIASLAEIKIIDFYIIPKPTLDETRKLLGVDLLQQSIMTLQEPVYDFWLTGKSYTGEGVTVANGENISSGYKHLGLCEQSSDGNTYVRFDDSHGTKFYDSWGFTNHGLHTAGIIGGNGWGSQNFLSNTSKTMNFYRGIAPKVKFRAYPTADVNSHSFVGDPGYYTGSDESKDDYQACHATDTLDYYNNILVVAASNAGYRPHGNDQVGYYSLEQNSKNAIIVGATANNEIKKADFSSMGPTRDGRIKPDVMAPGTGSLGTTQYSIEVDSISIVNNGVKKTWDFNSGDPTFNDWSNDVVNPNISGGIYSFTTGPGYDCYMFSQPITPQIVSDISDTLLIRMKVIPQASLVNGMDIGIMLKRPQDAFAKADNPWTSVSKNVPVTRDWQTIIIPLTGDPQAKSENGGWVTGDIIERIRLDFASPTSGMLSLDTNNSALGYVRMSGTSMASPAVAGVAALMLQKYGEYLTKENIKNGTTLNIHKNPMWNSTVRGILIHTAIDMVDLTGNSGQASNPDFVYSGFPATDIYTAGPDWATGWGMVNPARALEYTNPKVKFFEGSVNAGQLKTFNFSVPSSQRPSNYRVTLCWDDPAKQGVNDASTAYEKKLINDLDIYIKNVATGTIIRPWTLYQIDAMHANTRVLPSNGLDPITPDMIRNNVAVRGIDTLNNVEVIDFTNLIASNYQIVVSGQKIITDQSTLSGVNQDFSLIFDITPDISSPYELSTVATSRSQINLSWKDKTSGSNSGFNIERATGSGVFSQIASVGPTVTTYSNTGLTQNTKYRYRVRANTTNGYSDYTNIDSTTTHTNLAQGKSVTVSSYQTGNTGANAVDGNSTSTRWAAVSSSMPQSLQVDLGGSRPISGCEIVFEKTGTSGDCNDFKIETSNNNSTWTTNVNLPSNTNTAQTQSYNFATTARYVKITITDAPGTYWASIYEFRVFGSPCPSQVTGLTSIQADDNQLKLSWQAAYGATSYTVKMATAQGGPYYTVATGLTTTSYTTKDLALGVDYYFIVVAVNASGASVNSAEYSASQDYETVPNAPSSLGTVPASQVGYILTWKDNSNYETGFEIERRNYGGTTWAIIARTSENQTSYEDYTVESGTIYEYRVHAMNAAGFSANSPVAVTLARTPSSLTYEVSSDKSVMLSWVCDGYSQSGYTIESSTDGVNFTVLLTFFRTFIYVSGLTPNTTYYYRVNSYNSAGKSSYSNVANVIVPDPCYNYGNYGYGYYGIVFGLEPAWGSGYEYCKATDGDINSFYNYAGPDGGYTGLDLGTAKNIGKIRFYPVAGWAQRMIGGKFQGSNTSSTSGFVDLYTISSAPPTAWNLVSIATPTAYRWVRYLSPNGGYGNIAEMEFYASVYTYEAEEATLSGSAAINTNHNGYSRTGFVDGFWNSSTAQVSFTVNTASAKSYVLKLRYSAGNGTCTTVGLYVNGVKIKNITCSGTANWDTWADESETVTLKAGNNTVAYKSETSGNSCINLDNLTVSP